MRHHLPVFPVTAVLVLLSLAAATYAHHGFVAWFDMTRSITVKGTVTSFDWTNPHAYIHIDVKNDKGAMEKWSAEMGGVAMLSRAGWRRDTVKPGDEITLIGRPARDGKPAALLDKVVLADGRELPASDLPLPPAEGAKTPKE
jgi:uncharacterized protein DUF6152